MARRCFSVLAVIAIAVIPVCLYTSAIVVILELGWGVRAPVDSILITQNYHIGRGVEDVANKLSETAKERVAYVAARGRLHSGAASTQFVMEESRRLGRTRSPSSNSMLLQPKQRCSVVDTGGNPIPRPAAQRYQSNHPTSLYQQQKQPRVISIGPWGGRGGDPFRMPGGTSVVPLLRSITVEHSSTTIHGLTYEYEYLDADGDKEFRRAGARFPEKLASSAMIILLPGEYLTAVEGTTAYVGGSVVVTSLAFRTSRGKTYGPYGGSGTGTATPFSFPVARGCIVGFWGRSGRLLDAIGVYIKPCAAKLGYGYPYPETGMKVTVSN